MRDRVVQAAILNVIEPIFEVDFAEHSYGFRPGRGAKDALRRVDSLLKSGYTHVVDADLKSYFDTIPHQVIMDRLKGKISDGRVLELIEKFLKQPVKTAEGEIIPELGTPQGAVLSPLLANMVLDPLDKLMAHEGFEMTRYADDFVVQCQTQSKAERALELIKAWVGDTGLKLHPDKTRIVSLDAGESFDFLGYNFHRSPKGKIRRFVRVKSKKKFRDTVRTMTLRLRSGSIEFIIGDLNAMLRGWFEYFKHAYKSEFRSFDSFVRRRFRRLLRRRNRFRRGTGQNIDDHLRWPNVYFRELGLFSLNDAYREALRPLRR